MRWLLPIVSGLCLSAQVAAADVLVAVGAPGEEEFAEVFADQVEAWRAAATEGGHTFDVLSPATRESLEAAVREKKAAASPDPFWLVLIGHGTFDGRTAKFNLEGDDVAPEDLAEWLAGSDRPLVIADTTAASAPFLHALSGPNRIVVTATKDASETSFTHFGEFFANAVADPEADLDQDGSTSLLEAFLVASRKTREFFEADRRLASEEAMIDDNSDGRGSVAAAFDGLLSTQAAAAGQEEALPDGVRAHQVSLVPSAQDAGRSPAWKAQRDRLELDLFRLRERKDEMESDLYFEKLEAILNALGDLYLSPPG